MEIEATEESAFDILYNGFEEYQRKIKGYTTCPSRTDILCWENFKRAISKTLEKKKNGNNTTSSRPKSS